VAATKDLCSESILRPILRSEGGRRMYQLDETEIWREHRNQLLEEAKEGRLARRLKAERPERKRAFASAMRRRVALLLSTMGLAILLAAPL
jgi:hypothetical protein